MLCQAQISKGYHKLPTHPVDTDLMNENNSYINC